MINTKEVLSAFTAKDLSGLSRVRELMDEQGRLLGRRQAAERELREAKGKVTQIKGRLRKVERRLVRRLKEYTPRAAAILSASAGVSTGGRRKRRRAGARRIAPKSASRRNAGPERTAGMLTSLRPGSFSSKIAAAIAAAPDRRMRMGQIVNFLIEAGIGFFVEDRRKLHRRVSATLRKRRSHFPKVGPGLYTVATPQPKSPAGAAAKPGRKRRMDATRLVKEELSKARCALHARVLAERIVARGYKSGSNVRPLAHSLQSQLAALVRRGVLRRTAPATFDLVRPKAAAKA